MKSNFLDDANRLVGPWGTVATDVDTLSDPQDEFTRLHEELVNLNVMDLDRAALSVSVKRDRAVTLEYAARKMLTELDVHVTRTMEAIRTKAREYLAKLGNKRPSADQVSATSRELYPDKVIELESQLMNAKAVVSRCKALSDEWANRTHLIRSMMRR